MMIHAKGSRSFLVRMLFVAAFVVMTGLPVVAQVGSDSEQPYDETRARLAYFFQELAPSAIKPMTWLMGKPDNSDPLSLDSRLVMRHFETGDRVLTVSMEKSWGRKGKVKFLEVEHPNSIGEIVDFMIGMANLSYQGKDEEFGLAVYVDSDDYVHYFVEKGENGGWFGDPKVQPFHYLSRPNGKKMVLWMFPAHTHPRTSPPSGQDLEVQRGFSESRVYPALNLKSPLYSLVVCPGGYWYVFNSSEYFRGTSEMRKLSPAHLYRQDRR